MEEVDDAWGEPIERPAGPAPERHVLLTIRLTEEQVTMAEAAAERAGLRLTEFAKDRLIEASQQRTFTYRVVPQ